MSPSVLPTTRAHYMARFLVLWAGNSAWTATNSGPYHVRDCLLPVEVLLYGEDRREQLKKEVYPVNPFLFRQVCDWLYDNWPTATLQWFSTRIIHNLLERLMPFEQDLLLQALRVYYDGLQPR